MFKQFWNDECGAIISAELALVLTIVVLGTIVGLSEVAVAINTELNDISNAIGCLDQSYGFTGFKNASQGGNSKSTSYVSGTICRDDKDDNDMNTTCDIVCGLGNVSGIEGQR